ncbi:MAG: RNA polymerase sigma factor [Actinomycetota bacterium]
MTPGPVGFHAALQAAQQGEAWGFEALYRATRGRVGAFVAARGVDDVDDVVSETFLGVFRSLGRFEGGEGEFRSWLFRIARNKVADSFRVQGRRPPTVSLPDGFDCAGGDVESDADIELGRADLVRLFETLRPDQAEVLLLRLVGDFTVAQVATVMGRSEGAIKAHQRRALARLREELAQNSAAVLYPSGVLERCLD